MKNLALKTLFAASVVTFLGLLQASAADVEFDPPKEEPWEPTPEGLLFKNNIIGNVADDYRGCKPMTLHTMTKKQTKKHIALVVLLLPGIVEIASKPTAHRMPIIHAPRMTITELQQS
eukprot:GHVT01065913.1.p2 GENE.GHVT01065913.1~~GHVT01065913.1.p2  ORF type:complete len:118 (+),score=13.32 GHVT01065913.1:393-746(+)